MSVPSELVAYETLDEGRIARIWLSRPEAHNAQSRGLLVELDEAFLRAEADDAVAVGFDAKVAIHPTQVAVIRAAYAPTDDQVRWARTVLDAARSERGVFQFDGQMVDMPVLRRAQRIVRLAED